MYRYATAALSLTKFNHTTRKVLDIMTSLTERSNTSIWGSGTRSITEVKVELKTYGLFHKYGKFRVEELTAHTNAYFNTDNKRAEQNSEMLATCILTSVSPGTRAELHAICYSLKIDTVVYGELVYKGLMNKAITDNNQTTRYLQDQYDNIRSYMTNFDSATENFILE